MKGVSPLIATVLLIAIAVIIANLISNWSLFAVSEQTEDISNTSEQITNCPVMTIEDVYLDFAANKSRVFVKSSIEGNVDSARLVARSGVDMPLTTKMPLEVNRGEIKILEFNLTANLSSCVNFSQVIISTQCSSISYDRTPRNC